MASVYLTDFGLAKSAATGSKFTRTGQALGTPAYMSPEQARGAVAALTPATDVWALGCILYELLAGRCAFEGATPAEVIGQVLTAEPPDLRAGRPDVPAGVALVLRSALDKAARGRQPNAVVLRDDLDRALRGEAPRVRPRRAWPRAVAAAALALGTTAGSAWLVWPARGAAPDAPAPSEAEALARQARGLRTADPRQAASLLRRAIALGPTRDDWRLEHGLLCWAIGENAEARRLWSAIRPGAAEANAGRLYRGLEAFFRLEGGRLRWDEAAPDLRALAALPGREARLAGAALAVGAGRWAEARAALRAGDGWEAAFLRGLVEGQDPGGDLGVAVREYARGLEEGIRFTWALQHRAIARQAQGDVAGAIADFGAALELHPRLAEAWKGRADARRAQGDIPGAIADYGEALAINPGFAGAWTNRGLVREAQGDLAAAIADYGQALEIDPRVGLAWYNRGNARRAQGDLAGAIEDYGMALTLDARDTNAWTNRANARADHGDLPGAIDDYGAALAIDPTSARIWYSRGNVRQAQGDLVAAIEDYGKALELDPRSAEAWNNRGTARRAQGDLAAALEDFGKALEVDPRDALAWNNRGLVRETQGDLAGAVADLAQALAAVPAGDPRRTTIEASLARARAALAAQAGK